jgi:Fic family protein
MLTPIYAIPSLPLAVDLETLPVMKALARANRALAELKGRAAAIPNQAILINMLALQEAKASSEIENIVTTQDELFQADVFPDQQRSAAAKEVSLYREALQLGYAHLRATQGLIPNSVLIKMFQQLKRHHGGFRNTPGTALKNEASGSIVFVPPQDAREIVDHMSALERFINEDSLSALDPLIKMAIIHHQFESIHPFPDGNGRIGRILNVLYLTRTGLIDTPILYLSRYLTQTKSEYYRLLQSVRDSGNWEEWVLYILTGVAQTASTTLYIVEGIRSQMLRMKQRMRNELPKLYSQELLNNLFRHPYTRIEFVQHDLGLKARQSAAKYLDALAQAGFVQKHTQGRNNYYINRDLVQLFLDAQVATPIQTS